MALLLDCHRWLHWFVYSSRFFASWCKIPWMSPQLFARSCRRMARPLKCFGNCFAQSLEFGLVVVARFFRLEWLSLLSDLYGLSLWEGLLWSLALGNLGLMEKLLRGLWLWKMGLWVELRRRLPSRLMWFDEGLCLRKGLVLPVSVLYRFGLCGCYLNYALLILDSLEILFDFWACLSVVAPATIYALEVWISTVMIL